MSDGLHNVTLIKRSGKPEINGESATFHIGVWVGDLATALQGCLNLGLEITCGDIDNSTPFDPASPPRASFNAPHIDDLLVNFTASRSQWLGVPL